MRCHSTQKNLSAYLAGELDQRKMERVTKHIASCQVCALELERFEKLKARLDRLERVVPSPGFETKFWAKVKEAKQTESAPERLPGMGWTPGWKLGLSAALAVLVMVGVLFFWEGHQNRIRQRASFTSIEIAEIAKDMDFYSNYEIISEMDELIKFEDEGTENGNG